MRGVRRGVSECEKVRVGVGLFLSNTRYEVEHKMFVCGLN